MAKKASYITGSLFEEGYLVRTMGALVHNADIALTELVANAWDAGATQVEIFIPEDFHQKLVVSDNGTGLSKDQFEQRWMKLGYNRLKHQGKNVLFPPGVTGKRLAYGRNGVGRHGLLCFGNEYTVITNHDGKASKFVVTTLNEEQPFVIKEASFSKATTTGTRLEVLVTKNLPKAEKILKIISARFLHDPNFVVSINKQTVQLEEHSGLIDTTELVIDNIKLTAHFIDSLRSSRSTVHQGIAFWQSNRLVGEPSWILGFEAVVDGRTTFAKRYTVVIQTNDLADYVYEDWTGFKRVATMDKVYKAVAEYVNKMFAEIAMENIEETKQQVANDFKREIDSLSPLGRYEISEVIEAISLSHPTARPESLSIAVEAVINLEKTRSGKELLVKLAKLSDADIDGLKSLLDKWSIKDALIVLDEIHNRLSVIEAIRKLSKDENVDELHVLHPLVTDARWLFGPEFESAEYASNRQLHSAVETVFKKRISTKSFNNYKQRPDIVLLNDATASITGTEVFDTESNLATVNKVLIIELKRGAFKLTRAERNQAQGYVEDFVNCGALIGSPYVEAFVVGDQFSEKITPIATVKNDNNVELGKIRITTFSQLVDTAEKRLFGLRQKLNERYDDIPGMDLFNQKYPPQLSVDFRKEGTND
ncbi:ATP-binding protein [Mucilaginibacter ximonensis]|uniref:ATP-binding protein n=1 Tax=Mucilaginibacter ximonensis TaxID=538021 RepID=A0ABW5YAH1_9SPHI